MRSLHNIFLIGPMGSGKTTVGRQVARAMNVKFYDSDREIEARTGVDIPMIFDYEGEDGFRTREQSMIDGLTQLVNIVLATGGGAVLRRENRANLKSRGFVVYLKCSVHCQLTRTRKDRSRPLLDTDNPERRLQELIDVREPLYLECANHIVNTEQWSTRSVVRDIIRAFKENKPMIQS